MVGDATIFVRAGSLESLLPFAVNMNGSSFKEIRELAKSEHSLELTDSNHMLVFSCALPLMWTQGPRHVNIHLHNHPWHFRTNLPTFFLCSMTEQNLMCKFVPTTTHTSPQTHDREQARSETVDAISQRHPTHLSSS